MYGEKRTPIFFSSVLVRKGREQTDKYYCTSKKKGAGESECNIHCVLFILSSSTMNLSAKKGHRNKKRIPITHTICLKEKEKSHQSPVSNLVISPKNECMSMYSLHVEMYCTYIISFF
jgi:hypothetical protein